MNALGQKDQKLVSHFLQGYFEEKVTVYKSSTPQAIGGQVMNLKRLSFELYDYGKALSSLISQVTILSVFPVLKNGNGAALDFPKNEKLEI